MNLSELETVDASQHYLLTILDGNCSDELIKLYSQLLSVFNEINYTGHIDELELLYSKLVSQSIDISSITSVVEDVLRTSCSKLFDTIGVGLNDDIPMNMLVEATDILLNFDPTEFPSIVYHCVESEDDSIEAIMKLLEKLGTYTSDEWFPYIADVSGDLIDRIMKVCMDEMNKREGQLDIKVPSDLLQRIGRTVKQKPDTLGAQLAEAQVGGDISLEALYERHVGRFIDMDIRTAVDNLYSLAAISNVSLESLDSKITDCLYDLYVDLESRREVDKVKVVIDEQWKDILGVVNE